MQKHLSNFIGTKNITLLITELSKQLTKLGLTNFMFEFPFYISLSMLGDVFGNLQLADLLDYIN
jgi:hypothetical protein